MRAWPTVFVIALLAFGLGFVGGCAQTEQAEEAATESIEEAAETTETMMEEETMMVDPVCGEEVAMAEAVTYEYEGKMYYFCCEDCLNKFKEDPAAYMTTEEEMPEEEGMMGES